MIHGGQKKAAKALLGLVLVLICHLPALPGVIWLKASVGQAAVRGGDYNLGVDGSNDLYRSLYSNVNGVFSKLDRGLDLDMEIGYSLSSRLSLGLSLGYLQFREADAVEYDWRGGGIDHHNRISVEPLFQAIPVMANIHYSLPIWKIRLNLMAGGGAYICRFRYDEDFESTQFDWKYSYAFKASQTVPAVHAGIGLEVPLSRRLSVVLDVTGRYARADEIKGDGALSGSLDGLPYSAAGGNDFFWRYDYESGDNTYPQTAFQEYVPTNPDVSGARKARLNFNGFAAKIGFKFGF